MNGTAKISPYKGMMNIVRFNWPIYAFVSVFILILFTALLFLDLNASLKIVLWIILLGAILNTLITLLVSHYIYDRSPLYSYSWLDKVAIASNGNFANIHSGFDETSEPLQKKFPGNKWTLCDFYNPVYNTEGSIQRARKMYPCPAGTITIDHKNWNLVPDSLDTLFCLFAVHEIRDIKEKILFFEQASLHLKQGGKLIMSEHQRDLPNFLAFGYGAFHFFSFSHWKKAIKAVPSLQINEVYNVTPFIKIFILEKK